MKLVQRDGASAPAASAAHEPAPPLWQRAPARDADGARLTDFMMLIPGLRARPAADIERITLVLRGLLERNRHVVFANLDLKLNLLWVSLRPRQGAIAELAAAIRLAVPEAKLVVSLPSHL